MYVHTDVMYIHIYVSICKYCSSLPNHTVLLIVSYPRVEYELLYICMYVGTKRLRAGGYMLRCDIVA